MKTAMKRITTLFMAFVMFFVFALQAVAEDGTFSIQEILLPQADGVEYYDEYGYILDEKYNYTSEYGYTLAKEETGYVITPESNIGPNSKFEFAVKKIDGRDANISAEGLVKPSNIEISKSECKLRDDENQYIGDGVLITITFLRGAKVTNTGGVLTLRVSYKDAPYNVTLPSNTGDYEIIGNTTAERDKAYTFSLLLNPDMADHYPRVTVTGKNTVSYPEPQSAEPQSEDSESVWLKYSYTIEEVTEDIKISVSLKAPINISLPQADNGQYTVEAEDSTPVRWNSDFSFKVIVASGYGKPTVTINGKQESPVDEFVKESSYKYTIENVQATPAISIAVAKQKCGVTVNKSNDQAFTTSAETTSVDYGSSYTFWVEPKPGYDAPNVGVTGVSKDNVITSGVNYTVKNITGDVEITITGPASQQQVDLVFNQVQGITYQIEKEDGNFEDLTGNSMKVNYGGDVKFKIVKEEGYNQSMPVVTVGAERLDPDSGSGVYTVENITSRTVISVSGVVLNTYSVKLVQGTGYTLSSNQDTVQHGQNFSFRVTAKPGYSIQQKDIVAKIEQSLQTVEYDSQTDYYYIKSVTGDLTIEIPDLQISKYNVTIPSDTDKYTIIPKSESDTINYDGSYTFTLTPKRGYRISAVSYTMNKISYPLSPLSDGSYAINHITGPVEIKVNAEMVTYTVTYYDPKAENLTDMVEYTVKSEEIIVDGDGYFTLPLREHPHYTFVGWYSGSNPCTWLQFTNENKTISLTAKYEVNNDELYTVKLKNEYTTDGNSYSLSLEANWETVGDLGNIEILDCGFFYSTNKDVELNKTFVEACLEKIEGHSRELIKVNKDKDIYIYNFEDSALGALGGKFSVSFTGNNSISGDRYALAYVHVKINDVDYYYFSNINMQLERCNTQSN